MNVQRSDLETKRSPSEMQDLLRRYTEDLGNFADRDIHLRRGIVKDILEEYLPLCTLAANLPNVESAHLTPPSNTGPDALVEVRSSAGTEMLGVQITVADQSRQQALTRELLSQGQPAFQNTQKARHAKDKTRIMETGRALTTREARLRGQVAEVTAAVRKKINKFYPGTHILLVGARILLDDSSISYSWRSDLKGQIEKLGSVPYQRVYLASGDGELIALL